MKLKAISTVMAASALAFAPLAANAASADRASAPVSEESELGGGLGPIIILGLVAVAVVAAVAIDSDDFRPVSA